MLILKSLIRRPPATPPPPPQPKQEIPLSLEEQLAIPVDGYAIVAPFSRCMIRGTARFERPCQLMAGFETYGGLELGAFSYSWTWLSPWVRRVGRYCSIASGVNFGAQEHPTGWLSTSSFVYEPRFLDAADKTPPEGRLFTEQERPAGRFTPIDIGHDVWIGMDAYIRSGVTLGTGCIVAAKAVVTKDVPRYAVVAGNPARVIRFRFPEMIIERMLRVAWWQYNYNEFRNVDVRSPDSALSQIEELVAGGLKPFAPGFVDVTPSG